MVLTNSTDTYRYAPCLQVRIGAVAALVLGIFIATSHLPDLPAATRQGVMIVAVLTAMFLILLGLRRVGWIGIMAVTVPAIFLIVTFGLHNSWHPSLSDYAISKRALFPIIILSSLVVFPLLIHAYDRDLKSTMRVLVTVSVIFALLAFVPPTGANVRRSGIELNPLMHAKLLFFPFFLLLVRPERSPRSLAMLAILLFSMVACLRTGSRSPIGLAILILCFDLIVLGKLKILFQRVLLGVLIVASLFLMIDFFPREITERFSLDSLVSQSREGDRLFLFGLAVNLITDNPGGIGMGNMSAHFWINAPHNIVLEAVMDFGFLVSFPYLLLLGYTTLLAVAGLKSRDTANRFTALWYLYFLGHSLIGGEMTFPSMLLYMPMGLLILNRMRVGRPLSNRRRGLVPSPPTLGTQAQIVSPIYPGVACDGAVAAPWVNP